LNGAKVIPINGRLEVVWAEYLAARQKAEKSVDINDGIAAGRAYRRWPDLFLTDDQRAKLGALK
jgi:hypothetical protein